MNRSRVPSRGLIVFVVFVGAAIPLCSSELGAQRPAPPPSNTSSLLVPLGSERTSQEAVAAKLDRALLRFTTAGAADPADREVVVAEYAGTVSGLYTGLTAASNIAEVASITLAPAKITSFAGAADLAGKLGMVTGLVAAATSQNSATGLKIAGGSTAVRQLVDFVRNYWGENNSVRNFTEHVAMHAQFAGEVRAVKEIVSPLATAMQPLAADISKYDATTYKDYKVKQKTVNSYQSVVDTYSVMATEFQKINTAATSLLGQSWTSEITDNLRSIQKTSADAATAWRAQSLKSASQLLALRALAKIDDPNP